MWVCSGGWGGAEAGGVGKEGFEPSRLAATDPKSVLSANSSTSPMGSILHEVGGFSHELPQRGERMDTGVGKALATNRFARITRMGLGSSGAAMWARGVLTGVAGVASVAVGRCAWEGV